MWILTANKCAKFHTKRYNRCYFILNHPIKRTCITAIDCTNWMNLFNTIILYTLYHSLECTPWQTMVMVWHSYKAPPHEVDVWAYAVEMSVHLSPEMCTTDGGRCLSLQHLGCTDLFRNCCAITCCSAINRWVTLDHISMGIFFLRH